MITRLKKYARCNNEENIRQEHICCAISSNSDVQVRSKKDWLYDRFEDGLVFIKSSVRGKCFIEYIPQRMRGLVWMQKIICILIVYGYLDL